VNSLKRLMLDGNGAATEAMRLARIKVVSAYPITPQSPVAEKFDIHAADGKLDAKYIRVESEHTAMSCAIGAQFTGVRAGTATSSVGLALMHEVLGIAAGCRVPIVMPVINRALVSPWSLWCDHQDAMAERDTGWMQFYTEDAQEVLDMTLIAYHVAEDERVLLPAMVCLDGFFLSHMTDAVYVPDQSAVDNFLPPYQAKNLILDPENPMFINDLTSPAEFTEFRYQQKTAHEAALSVIPEVLEKFKKHFKREHFMVEPYRCEDAEAVLIGMGSMAGTIKYTVDNMRLKGIKVGMVKVVSFRPFPAAMLRSYLMSIPKIGVIDRIAPLGAECGPLCSEIKAAMFNNKKMPYIQGFTAGLGGRDITPENIEKAFKIVLEGKELSANAQWLDVKDDAMYIREVAD
jgi:pyruvate ferredoxin oxidoreductase alpha subunit